VAGNPFDNQEVMFVWCQRGETVVISNS